MGTCVAPHGPWRMEACVGISPPLESSPEEGIPDAFLLPCQVSFLQHRLNFLPPACPALRVGTQEWSLTGGGGRPRATCHKRKHLSNRHPGPQGGLHSMRKGLNLRQGQQEWEVDPEWEGGLLKKGKEGREGQGPGGWGLARGKHFVLCV